MTSLPRILRIALASGLANRSLRATPTAFCYVSAKMSNRPRAGRRSKPVTVAKAGPPASSSSHRREHLHDWVAPGNLLQAFDPLILCIPSLYSPKLQFPRTPKPDTLCRDNSRARDRRSLCEDLRWRFRGNAERRLPRQ